MCLIHISAIVMLPVCADRMYYTDLKVVCDISHTTFKFV